MMIHPRGGGWSRGINPGHPVQHYGVLPHSNHHHATRSRYPTWPSHQLSLHIQDGSHNLWNRVEESFRDGWDQQSFGRFVMTTQEVEKPRSHLGSWAHSRRAHTSSNRVPPVQQPPQRTSPRCPGGLWSAHGAACRLTLYRPSGRAGEVKGLQVVSATTCDCAELGLQYTTHLQAQRR